MKTVNARTYVTLLVVVWLAACEVATAQMTITGGGEYKRSQQDVANVGDSGLLAGVGTGRHRRARHDGNGDPLILTRFVVQSSERVLPECECSGSGNPQSASVFTT